MIYAVRSLLLVLLALAAVQDYKTREVSNWITLPLFFAGVAAMLLQHNFLSLVLTALVIFFWQKGWMGGADAKVFVGLLGIWYTAALAAFFAVGIWGAVLLLRKERKSFPALVAIAVGTGLTYTIEISIMLLN